jgi:anti-sigma B factor antagonist
MPSEHLIVQAYENLVLAKITKERLLDAPVIAALGEDLLKLVDRYPRMSLVLDISDVSYLSSAFIGKLVALFKSITTHKGRMTIAGAKPSLMPLFQVTRLDKVITFESEAEKAILFYKRKPI